MEATSYDLATNSGVFAAAGVAWLVYMAFIVLLIVAQWKIFEKAGEAGWKSLIPFYGGYVLFQIAGRNGLGFLLLFIPLVNIVVGIMLAIDLAKHFGKSAAFGVVGLFFFNVIGMLMLAFGDAKYVGPKHA
jgi:hypothetical protein